MVSLSLENKSASKHNYSNLSITMDTISSVKILELFNNSEYLQTLYDQAFPKIEKYVKNNSGTYQDAGDLFQESIILVYKKAKDPTFELTSSIDTFIYAVAKNKWHSELRKKRKSYLIPELENIKDNIDIEEMIIYEEKNKLYAHHFNLLSEGCKKLFRLYFLGHKMSEIAHLLGFASEGYARKRKHVCQSKLLQLIKNDSLFKELKNE